MNNEVRPKPCEACPYRRDVPSGLWASHEYEKLRPYDEEMISQPSAGFACHATPEKFCNGWAIVNNALHHGHVLALRLAGMPVIPEPKVALFTTNAEAADHGQRDIDSPSVKAREVVERLTRKHERLER
jgi:hypothetical protein